MRDDSRVFEFAADLWLWRENGAWHFITVPPDVSDEIEDLAGPRGGFGSVKVEATVGGTTWRTSLFPSTEQRSFVMPVKRAVRVAESCGAGDRIRVRLSLQP
ncbi:DUF1905 domain-containing protein [Aeromicrobium duanguangcaii]|uniref:DUF1905 domain-containing protein n=1 Tax=Aeromicrobium duanguangcaii TaxID=2968086 RepID=A0ABY5KAU4_9ACTN|nr:DUF1905 domain-containing protein [Aeromicrobium duanguangcaii]MCD9152852.1 DUF1905 domain-containing protein [Aeromicrobium duanguangcaii]UUI67168.1 DUF1905 domain-containing protein [Aeromicrobium duanguangcaii]